MVPTSTSRSKEVPYASKVLIKKSLGSLFFHLGLWSGAAARELRGYVKTLNLTVEYTFQLEVYI